jgi:hypothetical protein
MSPCPPFIYPGGSSDTNAGLSAGTHPDTLSVSGRRVANSDRDLYLIFVLFLIFSSTSFLRNFSGNLLFQQEIYSNFVT